MPRIQKVVAVVADCAVAACDQKPSREEQIAQPALQDAYDHNIERMAGCWPASTHGWRVPPSKMKLRKHLTVEDQRQDLFRLYSEHFSDAEFATIVAAPRTRPRPVL